jgi:transposase
VLADPTPARPPARGLTVREAARYLRVGEDRIRSWIRAGELGAVSTADPCRGRPRWVILPHHLAAWERRRTASPPPKTPRRRRQPQVIDFYPD